MNWKVTLFLFVLSSSSVFCKIPESKITEIFLPAINGLNDTIKLLRDEMSKLDKPETKLVESLPTSKPPDSAAPISLESLTSNVPPGNVPGVQTPGENSLSDIKDKLDTLTALVLAQNTPAPRFPSHPMTPLGATISPPLSCPLPSSSLTKK